MDDLRVVDFSKASRKLDADESEEDWREIGEEIVECFENIGFVYIKNHGISQQLIDSVFEVSRSFFKSPEDFKSKVHKNACFMNGYMGPNDELLEESKNFTEMRESFDIMDKSSDYLPKEIEGFERNTLKLIEEGAAFYRKLLRCLEVGLKLPYGTLLNIHTNLCSESNVSTLRLLYYPPIPEEIPKNSIRCGAHTDYGSLTVLFQDKMGGLEVKNRHNDWVKADPIPGALLVNVGDMLQQMTSGRVVATEHRVLIPEEEMKKKCSRMSVVFFLTPNLDTVLKPFDKSYENDDHYLTSYDFFYKRMSSTIGTTY